MVLQQQKVEHQGHEPEHTHGARIHEHDHYHIALYHKGGMLGEWDHRTYWHTHNHNHGELTHSHDYRRVEEEQEHGKEAHIHDHASPAESHA